MTSLACVHLGVHALLPTLPSFDGLYNLKRMTIAYLFSITELPSFESLKRLERLEFVFLLALRSIPDLTSAMEHLRSVNVFRPNEVYCNGFIGACDLSHPYCTADSELLIPHSRASQRPTLLPVRRQAHSRYFVHL